MNRKTLGALIALNSVLLAGLAAVCLSPKPAQAQGGFAGSNYLMISGDVQGRESQASIYVIDVNTGQILTVMFNGSNKQWEVYGVKDVKADLGMPR